MGFLSWMFRSPTPIPAPAPDPSWPCTTYTCMFCDEPLLDTRTIDADGVEVALACPDCGRFAVKYKLADDPLAESFRPYTDAEIGALRDVILNLSLGHSVGALRCPIDGAPLSGVKEGSAWKLHCIRCGNDATFAIPD